MENVPSPHCTEKRIQLLWLNFDFFSLWRPRFYVFFYDHVKLNTSRENFFFLPQNDGKLEKSVENWIKKSLHFAFIISIYKLLDKI